MKDTFIPYQGNHHHPHILRCRSLLAALTVATLLEFTMLLGSLLWPILDTQLAAVLPSVITLLTNDTRRTNHLPGLEVNHTLTLAAQSKARDMALKGYFAHVSPNGAKPWFWLDQAGYQYQYAGENLAVNFTDSEELVKAWQNSPTHNMNLLGPRYSETGVGVAKGIYQGREAVFVVQFFATPIKVTKAVLGMEAGMETNDVGSPSVWMRITSSPRTYGTYSLLLFALLFMAVLVIGWGRHHHRAFAYGLIMITVLAGLIFVNKHLLFPELELPLDTQYGATAISALMR